MSIVVKIGSGAIAQAALASQHAAEASATAAASSAAAAAASASSAANNATKLHGTSLTSNSIGAVGQSRTFTTQADKAFDVGTELSIYATSDAMQRMSGHSTAYDSITGVLTIAIDSTVGSGTFADWQIKVTGEPGLPGIQGPPGDGNATRVQFAAVNVDLTTMVPSAIYDGHTIQSGDVFIAPLQADRTANGIYVVQASGDPQRHTDFNTADAHCGAKIQVQKGAASSLYGGTEWLGVSPLGGTLGSSEILFSQSGVPDEGTEAVTTGLSDSLDSGASLALIGYDPVTGPAVIRGDRYPNLPGIDLWFFLGQSGIATGPGDNSAVPSIHKVPIRPERFLMYDACNLYGLATTDITTLDLTRIVAARERITESWATGFVTQLLDYEDTNRHATRTRMIVNCAQGGADYARLKKGTRPFGNMLNAAQDMIDRFGAGSVQVAGCLVDAFESNAFDTQATVEGFIDEWYDDINSDVDGLRSITGQARSIPMYFAHFPFVTTPTNAGDGPLDALITKHVAALADPAERRMFIVGSQYQFFFPTKTHMGSRAIFECGAMAGQAVSELIYEGGNGVFWPQGASIDGNDIVVTTNATTDLIIDTDMVTDRGNAGFVVTDSGGAAKTIGSVNVVDTNVVLTMSTAPAVGWIVKYARTDTRTGATGPGGRGNIRDSRTTVIAHSRDPIYQWMLSKNLTVA